MSNRAPVIIAHFYYMHSQANLSWLKQCFGYVWFANNFVFYLFVRSIKSRTVGFASEFCFVGFFIVGGVFVARLLYLIYFTHERQENKQLK